MKFCTAVLAVLAISYSSFSQSIPKNPNVTDVKGMRQGKWTVFLNDQEKPTLQSDSLEYYRVLSYKNDKPVALVTDYYKSGKVYRQSNLLADRPQEIKNGTSTTYQESGLKKLVQVFKNGKLVSEVVYNLDGTEAKESFDKITNAAMDAYSAGKYDLCVTLFEKRLEQAKKQFGDKHYNYSAAMNDLGVVYGTVGQFAKAESVHLKAMEIQRETIGTENLDYASSLNNLAEVYKSQAKYDQAKPLYKRTVAIEAKLLGADNPELTISLQNFARLFHVLNQYDSSLFFYQKAESIYIHNNLKETTAYAVLANSMGSVYDDLGKYEIAEKLYVEGLNIRARKLGKEHPSYLISLNNLGTLQYKLGYFDGAESIFREISSIYKKVIGTENTSYALAINNLGLVLSTKGEFVEAEKLLEEAIDIRQRIQGKDHPEISQPMHNLAQLYTKRGNYTKAEAQYTESLRIVAQSLGKEHSSYSQTLGDMGPLYLRMGDYKRAEIVSLEVKRIREKVLGKNHVLYASVLHNLASVYVATGSFAKAEELYMQCLGIEEKLLGKEHADYAHTVNSLAELNYKKRDFKKAEKYYKQAIAIRSKTIGQRNPLYTKSLYGLANTYAASSQLLLAEQLFSEMLEGLSDQVKTYFPSLSEYEKESFYFTLKEYFESFNAFAVERSRAKPAITEKMFDNQLSTKAILFNSNQKIRNAIALSNDSLLIDLFKRWQVKRNYLSKVYQMTVAERSKDSVTVDQLEDEINAIEKELASRSEVFSKAKEKEVRTWKDVQKALNKEDAVVEIIRLRKSGIAKTVIDTTDTQLPQYNIPGLTDTVRYVALLVTPKSKYPEIIILENGNDLDHKFLRAYKNSIQFKVSDSVSYTQFWKPIAKRLKKQKVKNVYVSPDGVYNIVNLNVLLNPETGNYVADETNVKYVTNSKDIITVASESKPIRDVFLFGYPDYLSQDSSSQRGEQRSLERLETDSVQRFFKGGVIARLPGTKVEVDVIDNLMKQQGVNANKLINEFVTEERFKLLKNPDVIHIATHGFFLEDVQAESFVGFDISANQNPLFRSGLLLTGAQRTINGEKDIKGEDGILTAYEAMNLSLDNTELVVLSACETGLGEIRNGEGVYGLQRAFQTAGAKSILMSLWKVDDNATQELMTAFYKDWLKTGDKRTAFKNAQVSVRKKYPHPYYWGAFVLVGE